MGFSLTIPKKFDPSTWTEGQRRGGIAVKALCAFVKRYSYYVKHKIWICECMKNKYAELLARVLRGNVRVDV